MERALAVMPPRSWMVRMGKLRPRPHSWEGGRAGTEMSGRRARRSALVPKHSEGVGLGLQRIS